VGGGAALRKSRRQFALYAAFAKLRLVCASLARASLSMTLVFDARFAMAGNTDMRTYRYGRQH